MAKEEGRRAKDVSDSRSDKDIIRITCGCVPHASVGGQHEEHVAGHTIVDFEADGIVQLRFTYGRYSPKNSTHKEECWPLHGSMRVWRMCNTVSLPCLSHGVPRRESWMGGATR